MAKKKLKKEVVICKGWNRLLTPYWIVEYMKRKDIELYCYEEIINGETIEVERYEIRDAKTLNDFEDSYMSIIYSMKYYGDILSVEEYNNVVDWEQIISVYEMFQDREDKDLIDIAKKIGNKKYIKVIKIPKSVEYYVRDCECSAGEYIEEKHRVWD